MIFLVAIQDLVDAVHAALKLLDTSLCIHVTGYRTLGIIHDLALL